MLKHAERCFQFSITENSETSITEAASSENINSNELSFSESANATVGATASSLTEKKSMAEAKTEADNSMD